MKATVDWYLYSVTTRKGTQRWSLRPVQAIMREAASLKLRDDLVKSVEGL